jgi:anti-sigma factor RsiW
MNCDTALPLLYDLVDNELAETDRPALDEHLAVCAVCQKQLLSLRAAEPIYKNQILAEPAAELAARIIAAQQALAYRPAINQSSWRMRAAALGGIAASFAALGYLAIGPASEYTLPWLDYARALVPADRSLAINITRAYAELRIDLLFNQLLENIVASGDLLAGALPINNTIVIVLIMAQIIISYRLLRGGELLRQNKN